MMGDCAFLKYFFFTFLAHTVRIPHFKLTGYIDRQTEGEKSELIFRYIEEDREEDR